MLIKYVKKNTPKEKKAFVKYLNGHPLTIKLVAGFLGEYCNSQLREVAALELEQFDLAYEEATRDHRHKQDARLSWIIQQHLARLNSEQKQLLTNLSVYRLPFDYEAARYMLVNRGVKPFVVQKKLQELCHRSLLIKTEDNKCQFESLVQKFILKQATNLTNAHQQAIEYYRSNLKDRESWQVLADVSEYLELTMF